MNEKKVLFVKHPIKIAGRALSVLTFTRIIETAVWGFDMSRDLSDISDGVNLHNVFIALPTQKFSRTEKTFLPK